MDSCPELTDKIIVRVARPSCVDGVERRQANIASVAHDNSTDQWYLVDGRLCRLCGATLAYVAHDDATDQQSLVDGRLHISGSP